MSLLPFPIHSQSLCVFSLSLPMSSLTSPCDEILCLLRHCSHITPLTLLLHTYSPHRLYI